MFASEILFYNLIIIYQVISGAVAVSKSIHREELAAFPGIIVMFCCGSALEAQRAGTLAAANKNKRLTFTRATCDG